MRRTQIAVGVGFALALALIACGVLVDARSNADQGDIIARQEATNHRQRAQKEHAKKSSRERSRPSDESNPKVGLTMEQTVEWQPIECWDCNNDDPASVFLVGLFVAAPIFVWRVRARTRKRELAEPKRFFL
jgi:hypothetical protein